MAASQSGGRGVVTAICWMAAGNGWKKHVREIGGTNANSGIIARFMKGSQSLFPSVSLLCLGNSFDLC